jgi:hypothetical protein
MATLHNYVRSAIQKLGLRVIIKTATEWFKNKLKQLTTKNNANKNTSNAVVTTNIEIGKLYFFIYDPKWKMTLPYYDTFPLVLFIEKYNDSYLGLNLHYIYPQHRIVLLDKLIQLKQNAKLSYALLSGASKLNEFQPCLKKYLKTHVKSKFMEIPAKDWAYAAMLPNAESFVKATKEEVWKDSKNKY